jgi:hypothetical protein
MTTAKPIPQVPQDQSLRVQTFTQLLEMKGMLHELLKKVEVLEQKKPAPRYDDARTGSNDEQTSLLEKMAKDQAGYLAGTQKAVTDVLRMQQGTDTEISRINESSRYVLLL